MRICWALATGIAGDSGTSQAQISRTLSTGELVFGSSNDVLSCFANSAGAGDRAL